MPMRLLKYREDGEIVVTSNEADEKKLPPYAILSHRWETDEVTFEDLQKNIGKEKLGYKKIWFCGEQAKRDGLHHFWVDTCCIDKTDKAELSHAIRSMFRWYQNANKCYVYLSDVSSKKGKLSDLETEFIWEPAFRTSRWFTRGWTLQELLAPKAVEFFSHDWHRLGDRVSLKAQIHQATAIPHNALGGTPLSHFSVDERFRWSQNRETTRKEDAAYCLFGIFDVDIAPIYGEGIEEAYRRLRGEIQNWEECLRDLRVTDPCDDKVRIQNTKGGLLIGSYCWVLDNSTFQQWQHDPHSRLLWVRGDPGKGKTMLLCGIIDELYRERSNSALLAYFFCQATDSRIHSATAVLRGLLYMLVEQQPSLVSHIQKKLGRAGKILFEDTNAWVALTKIFEDVLHDLELCTTYLVIDALDECVTDLPKLLQFVAKQSSNSSCVKWLISSRNWPDIEKQLEDAGHKVNLSLELNKTSVAAAVKTFIKHKVDTLAQKQRYKLELRSSVLQHLISNANGTFLWVALVCQSLNDTPSRHVHKKLSLFPAGLDSLYKQMMDQISRSEDADMCLQVLALNAILYRPVTILELTALVEPLKDIVGLCGSFLTLQGDTIYFVHQSAQDFLLKNAFDQIFPDGTEAVHQAVFLRSLAHLQITLHRDMYRLEALGTPIDDTRILEPDPLVASRYSCLYWVDHLYDSECKSEANRPGALQVGDAVTAFISKRYLYWVEALSLCKSVAKGISSMARLSSLVQVWYAKTIQLSFVTDGDADSTRRHCMRTS
jgi:hypothetical protein